MKFKVGDRVEDKAFGKGTVVEINTGSSKKNILVKFDKRNVILHDAGENSLKGPYEKDTCWFYTEETQKQLKLIKGYTYEDLKKSPIGTKITFENGKVLIRNDKDYFENLSYGRNISDLVNLKDNYSILGKIIKIEEPEYTTVYEREKEILDEAEKRYLRGVIRPFRNRVDTIERVSSSLTKKDYIQIRHKDDEPTNFPYYNKGTMYKGMEINRRYTLEELGL